MKTANLWYNGQERRAVRLSFCQPSTLLPVRTFWMYAVVILAIVILCLGSILRKSEATGAMS